MKFATRLGIASDLYRNVIEKRLTAYDLTPAQLSALSHIARRGAPQGVSDIARAIDVGQPAVTKMLNKFERAGWVTISGSKHDRRIKEAAITQDGGMHIGQVHRSLMPELPQLLEAWSAAELERFTQDLIDLSQFLDRLRSQTEPNA